MISSTGRPHILLFERDQQMTALLMSEFQLAGYESHAARTAVEVFDAIARFPVRLVLVNLAQAAAARREFWVALDTQRRGKGVQVLTFHCTNIAGYGPMDTDERSQTMLADMEVEGIRGVRNLVEAVRARIPGTTTGSIARLMTSGATSETRQQQGPSVSMMNQATAPPPLMNSDHLVAAPSQLETEQPRITEAPRGYAPSQNVRTSGVAPVPRTPTITPSRPMGAAAHTPTSNTGTQEPTAQNRVSAPPSSFTDKIRAVIYPHARNYTPALPQEANRGESLTALPPMQDAVEDRPTVVPSTMIQAPANGVPLEQPVQAVPIPESTPQALPPQAYMQESSLAQLSRMLQEAASADERNEAVTSQSTRPMSLSDLPLRVSPIQDLPGEPEPERRAENTPPVHEAQQPTTLARPFQMTGPLPEVNTETRQVQDNEQESTEQETSDALIDRTLVEQEEAPVQELSPVYTEHPTQRAVTTETNVSGPIFDEDDEGDASTPARPTSAPTSTNNALLLDIVQSLPLMPPPPQPPVLSGRATRSLGSVLLEGNLVPKQRLEVALHIQHMLRGVDMHYQLGEILLMFKLLTHDQLLAASLVSYGLITTTQISALGRIRQELHSIGLDYDLESLLMLFRILTPEQLREVRTSWSG